MIDNYCISKSHTCHITSSLLQHVLKMSSSSTNASGKRWHHSQTAGSTTCISQGSVATVLKSGGQKYSDLCQFFSDVAGQKLLKSANTARSYSKNKKVARFMDHGVTWVWTYVQVAKLKNSSCRQFGMRGQTQVHSASFQMWTPEQRRACSHNS